MSTLGQWLELTPATLHGKAVFGSLGGAILLNLLCQISNMPRIHRSADANKAAPREFALLTQLKPDGNGNVDEAVSVGLNSGMGLLQ